MAERLGPRRLSSGMLGVLGFGCGCGSVEVAGRWGLSPLLLGVAGLIVVPLASTLSSRRWAGWRGQLSILAGFIVVCIGVARWTAYLSPASAFQVVFGKPLPAGLGPVAVERQYFDGQVISLAFHATRPQLEAIFAGQSFSSDNALFGFYKSGDRSWAETWGPLARPWVDIVAPGWENPPTTPATDFFERPPQARGGLVRAFWDAGSGQTYVLYAGE